MNAEHDMRFEDPAARRQMYDIVDIPRKVLADEEWTPDEKMDLLYDWWITCTQGTPKTLDKKDGLQHLIRGLRWIPYQADECHYRGEEILRWLAEAFYRAGAHDLALVVCEESANFIPHDQMLRSAKDGIRQIMGAVVMRSLGKDVPPWSIEMIPPPGQRLPHANFGGLLEMQPDFDRLHTQETGGSITEPGVSPEAKEHPKIYRSDGSLREPARKILKALPAYKWDAVAGDTVLGHDYVRRFSKPLQDAGLIDLVDDTWVRTQKGDQVLKAGRV